MKRSNLLAPSPLDSDRFGLRIFRGAAAGPVSARELFAELSGNAVDIAIVRTPSGSSQGVHGLARFGIHPIQADTLVYYQVALQDYSPKALRNHDVVFSHAAPEDLAELNALVAHTFARYKSHYHANPLLDPAKILAGYAEWASSYLSSTDGTRAAWVARRNGAIVAFACCSGDAEGENCEGILYGVHPDNAGGGLYGDLIRFTQQQYKARGFTCMKVSTQVWNLAVQKVWAREGFVLTKVYDTFHINAMLSDTGTVLEQELVFTPEQVAEFASVTGDLNSVHLDDDAARGAGFDARISHGMMAGGELSRIFGTVAPGIGTLFLRSELAFLAPIYAGRRHRLRIRYPDPIPEKGYMLAVATIHNADGELCLVGYNDLLRR
jgi:acyl dehydratase